MIPDAIDTAVLRRAGQARSRRWAQAYAWHATLSAPGADRATGFLEASPG
jgi:2'-5' RNA ligase